MSGLTVGFMSISELKLQILKQGGAGTDEERRAAEKLRAALIEMEAPKDQLERLALA